MSVSVKNFGKTKDGKEVSLFTISNANGVEAVVSDFGAAIVNLFVPNKSGEVKDIVLGYDNVAQYEVNPNFFGVVIGPNANRIADHKFSIDGVEYTLENNDGGNNLHSAIDLGFHKKIWTANVMDNAVEFTLESPDMEMGFPGNKKVSIKYSLNDDNELTLTYDGVSDKKTVFNMTNHSYFALGGHDQGKEDLANTVLKMNTSNYTDIVAGAIPTGNITKVEGTPMDFTSPKKIGDEQDADFDQLTMVGGYDHNFVIDDYDGTKRFIAEASYDGRTMQVFTDLPGVQFYASNCTNDQPGKNGASYTKRTAFCLETQYFPNSVNDTNFKSPIVEAGEKYHTETTYKFIF